MRERLGYEVTASLLRQPFYKTDEAMGQDNLYARGGYFAVKQKFYHQDSDKGMFYFAHEVRYTTLAHHAKDYDSTLNINRLLTSHENKLEYSLILGERWMQRAGAKGFTFDFFIGIGIGYRNLKPAYELNKKNNAIFENVKTQNLVIPLRAGFSVGYSF